MGEIQVVLSGGPWTLSANGAWVLDAGTLEPVLGPFSTRRIAGKLMAQEVVNALMDAYRRGQEKG